MSQYLILQTASTAQTNSIAWGNAKRNVARVVGGQDDAEYLAEAAEEIWAVIGEWNTRHPFRFIERAQASQAISNGDNTYALEADFLELLGWPRIEGSDINRPLFPLPEHLRSRTQYIQDSAWTGQPEFFSLFESGSTGMIVLRPIPANLTGSNLIVNYFRPISEPTDDLQTFDLPKRWVWGILAGAKRNMLANHNVEDRRLAYWIGEADRLFKYARAQDLRRADEVNRFVPRSEYMRYQQPEITDHYEDWC